jgi:glycosyltransferase involved in cell wall biosynthesis
MWPRLLYVGDVPVESTYHGSALLHRLLVDYPGVTIVETGVPSQAERRIPRANYLAYRLDESRWLKTRFHPYAVVWFTYSRSRNGHDVAASLNGCEFDCVLTVAHGFGWLAAASLARKHRVPLHLIVHDDWPRAAHVPGVFRNWFDRMFAKVYKQAQSRLCVSPSMQQAYYTRYGAPGDVLYPMRAANAPNFAEPPPRLAANDHQFTVAFAGTINSPGYIKALIALDDALTTVGGRLLIFGPFTPDQARQCGLDLPNIEICGLLRSDELMNRLRDEADVLFVPMSFDATERSNMEMSFPSKLVDYTAAGLPLLIYGPPYCSAVGWAEENPGVAEVTHNEPELAEAVRRLANDPQHRIELGKAALQTGARYFAHHTVHEVFTRAITTRG